MSFNFTLGISEFDRMKTKVNYRIAVRAVIIKNDEILMVRTNKGDYKFPGGGVENSEIHEQTLLREVREETGFLVTNIKHKLGTVLERSIDTFDKNNLFEMTSIYYLYEVSDNKVKQQLDNYELELDFRPEWVNIDNAIENNENILKGADTDINLWVLRETCVLRKLKNL